MPSLKQKVVKGAIWTLLEQWLQFVIGMVLARLLTPHALDLCDAKMIQFSP